jgi:hypothetical protein
VDLTPEQVLEIATKLAQQWNEDFANIGQPVEELYKPEDLVATVELAAKAAMPMLRTTAGCPLCHPGTPDQIRRAEEASARLSKLIEEG